MYYRLKENYLLRGWEKLPYALVDTNTGSALFINSSEMEALRLCDGSVDLSLPLIPQKIRDMIPLIKKNGIIEACSPGERILPKQAYKQYPARYIRTAHWSVTGRCNYRCKHCYMSGCPCQTGRA